MISVHDTGTAGALGELSRFREEFYQSVSARADTLFGRPSRRLRTRPSSALSVSAAVRSAIRLITARRRRDPW
jgi:hypothetical protein